MLVTGSVEIVHLSQDVSKNELPRNLWHIIVNNRILKYNRPQLFSELWEPEILTDLSPIERYVAYLYFTLGIGEQEIAFRLGQHRTVVQRFKKRICSI